MVIPRISVISTPWRDFSVIMSEIIIVCKIITHFLGRFLVQYRHTKVHKRHREVHALEMISKVETNTHQLWKGKKFLMTDVWVFMGKHICKVQLATLNSKICLVMKKNLFSLICDGNISHDQVSLKSMSDTKARIIQVMGSAFDFDIFICIWAYAIKTTSALKPKKYFNNL